MPQHQQAAAENHRLAHTQVAVRQQAADHWHRIDQRGIAAQHFQAIAVREQMVLGEVQQEQVFHAVEGKTLPQFGGETHQQATGMPEKPGVGCRVEGGSAGCCHIIVLPFKRPCRESQRDIIGT